MPPELLPFVEYGAVGVVMGVLYLIARLYAPHFAALSAGVQALPKALDGLAEAVREQGKELRGSIGEVKAELAVIKDRQPRPEEAVLLELIERRRARTQAQAAKAGD